MADPRLPGGEPEGADIVRALRRARRKNFPLLLDAYGDRVYRFFRRRLNDEGAADDLTQDTFLAAYTAFPRLRDGDRLGPWLFAIARNVLRNHINRTIPKLPPLLADDTVMNLCADGGDQPDELAEEQDDLAALQRAMAALPGDLQDTLFLAVYEELAYEEIAQVLDIPEGTVKSRIFRAREMLVAALVDQR
ncbi:MAG TPA: sigma-70 family RNA polymerase sigma factor [bacterium]|nr:sigma-70 family RNA polymerase sigma factor [bacterium]